MIIEKDLKKLFSQLLHEKSARIDVSGSNVTVKVTDHGDKLTLSTPVYSGGNYIPKSVRDSLKENTPFKKYVIDTFLSVNEGKYEVVLNYLGQTESLNAQVFINLLEEFGWLAQEWKIFLDERGGNDLIYIPVKPI